MCFDPGSVIVALSLAATTAGLKSISDYSQTKQANATADAQYDQQKAFQKRNNTAIQNQLDETVARNRQQALREGQNAQMTAQEKIIENLKRQGLATASAATAGITGQPLQNLFNDYQADIGNVSSNLQTQFQQLNENLFFTQGDAKRSAQSQFNQATPMAPIYQGFNILPALAAGAQAGMSALRLKTPGGGTGLDPIAPRGKATPLGPVFSPNPRI